MTFNFLQKLFRLFLFFSGLILHEKRVNNYFLILNHFKMLRKIIYIASIDL